ncbi:MAG: flagellar motor switch phosphatase FliY [Synergistaceae bacterium]|jgi:flagellar motor switch protein FliN/FliY|nr:flagellar motor switch phosphatase FliY [Synergistaceae bacterium]
MMDELLSQDEINALLSGGDISEFSSNLSTEDSQVLDEVASIFTNAESSVFGMLAGQDVDAHIVETAVSTQAEFRSKLTEAPFVFHTSFGGFDNLPLTFVVDRRGALTLADLMMGGEGKDLPEEASELYLNATQEGLSQVVGSAFTSLSGLLGGRRLMPENTTSALEQGEWLPFPNLSEEAKIWNSVAKVEIDGLKPFEVRVALPVESAQSIAAVIHQIMGEQSPRRAEPSPPQPVAAPPSARTAPPPPPPSFASPSFSSPSPSFSPPQGAQQPAPMVDVHPAEFTPLISKGPTGGGGNIDLIADIPVRVTVELGKTRKNISEILTMSTGSVIELDKMAGEPVDVLVNGKLIAKGEVVVIDENFGVRITEVLNRVSKAYSS